MLIFLAQAEVVIEWLLNNAVQNLVPTIIITVLAIFIIVSRGQSSKDQSQATATNALAEALKNSNEVSKRQIDILDKMKDAQSLEINNREEQTKQISGGFESIAQVLNKMKDSDYALILQNDESTAGIHDNMDGWANWILDLLQEIKTSLQASNSTEALSRLEIKLTSIETQIQIALKAQKEATDEIQVIDAVTVVSASVKLPPDALTNGHSTGSDSATKPIPDVTAREPGSD